MRIGPHGGVLERTLNSFDSLSAEFARRFGHDDNLKLLIDDLVARVLGGEGTVSDDDRQFLKSYDATCHLMTRGAHHIGRLNGQIRRANEIGADILLSKPLGASVSASLDVLKTRGMSQLQTVDMSKLDRSNLFQFIALNLGSVPYGATLTDSAALAKTPEAEALRLKTSQWFDELRSGRTADLVRLRKEIDEARRSIRRAERWSKASNITTTIGVPLSAVGLVSPIVSWFIRARASMV